MNLKTQKILIQNSLYEGVKNHKIWQNPLLEACEKGKLTKYDFKILFSQYYLYSKNFTKLLAVALLKSDSDFDRSKITENLWEEAGEKKREDRHAEIFRQFLVNELDIKPEQIHFESYTHLYVQSYLDLCMKSEPLECFAMLAFGTEGIVSRLYTILRKGMLLAGILQENLKFFNLHIECDDDHALTLEEIALSFSYEKNWEEKAEIAINKILDLRDQFFTNIHQHIQRAKLDSLVEGISSTPFEQDSDVINFPRASDVYVQAIDQNNVPLYQNKDLDNQINFDVQRIKVNADVLDPRVVTIPVGYTNENHRHAHETIFLILEGNGEILIGNIKRNVSKGDIVFVPRWLPHQTRNIGTTQLKFFAITDYGLTGRLSQNSESSYRKNKHDALHTPLILTKSVSKLASNKNDSSER